MEALGHRGCRFDGSAVAAVAAWDAAVATSGSAAEAAAASGSAQAVSVAVRAGDSLVAPSESSSSFARCRVSFRLGIRPQANRRTQLASHPS